MRTFVLLLCVAGSIGCSSEKRAIWVSHHLSTSQDERQNELLEEIEKIPRSYRGIIGRSASDFKELLSLPDKTMINDSEVVYQYHVPGRGEPHEGSFMIFVAGGKIRDSTWSYAEY